MTIPQLSFCDSHEIEEQAQRKLQELRRIKEIENEEMNTPAIEKQDPLSTFVFFLVREKHLQFMIPDFEVTSCKEIFSNPSCHEACFGLARLYCFEGKFQRALEYLDLALSSISDPIYKKWRSILTVKTTRQTETETIQSKSLLSCFLCCNTVRSQISVLQMLQDCSESVDILYGFMELSMKGFSELDLPEHYASKIKDRDIYIGYLAWSEVYFRRNEWQKGLDILKQLVINYSNRPEAYIKLWYHYYYNVKDYEQAEEVMCEASLMVTSIEFHHYYIVFCIYTAKTLFKLKRYRECLNLLQRKFLENPTYPIFLYMYGKYCTKSDDYMYNGTAIGALHECIRLCDNSRYGGIYYWLAKAYTQGRQHLEAYDTVKLALQFLDSSASRKVLELRRWMSDIQESIQKIEELERILASDLDSEGLKKCKELCAEVKDFHKLTVDVLYAKMLWKTGRHEEALKKLYAVSGISTVKMTAHFLLLQYLGEQNDLRCMKTVACEMVVKCKNPQVPANVWVKVNLHYAEILLKNKKPGKAIMILKLLAKVLPPIPFANIAYTKLLQRAKNLQDLTLAHTLGLESYSAYNYSTYKNSFIDGAFEVRDFSQRLIAEEAAPLPTIMEKRFKERRADRTVSERVNEFRMYKKKKTQEDIEIGDEDKKDNTLLGVNIQPSREFKSLTVCSDPIFLYKIGKISGKHRVSLQDGICAINDFIELMKFEKDRFKRLKMLEKAEKVRSQLYHIIKV